MTPILMFVALFALVFLGIPVSFSLLTVALVFGFGLFPEQVVGIQLWGMVEKSSKEYLLAAVPAFVMMGNVLERSGIAERLFQVMQLWLGRMPGGLALATIAMGAIFAASTGIVGAVEIVIGVMTIPVMMRYGYAKDLIAGTICAGGSLGTMIPPSLVAVIYASIANMSVGKLYGAMLLPGLLMVALFIGYIAVRCALRPQDGPPVAREEIAIPLGARLALTATGFLPAALLIAVVLGTTMFGIASPTEAASFGVLGAVALTVVYRWLDLSREGRLSSLGPELFDILAQAVKRTLLINCMILLIVVGGNMFASVFRLHGGENLVQGLVTELQLSKWVLIALCLLIVFAAGFILDWVSIVLICLPIFLPLIAALKLDPIWFATMMIIVIQTSYLTPPMAPSIFYLKSIAPPEITYRDMCLGVLPYVGMQLATLAAVMAVPELATWLPEQLGGF